MNRRSLGFLFGGLLVALLLAGVVSSFASAHPDGLDSSLRTGCVFDDEDNIVSGDCPAREARDHELADSPLADYGFRGIDNPYLSTGLSGVLGVLLTFAVGGGLFWLTRRRTGAQAAVPGAPNLSAVPDAGAPADGRDSTAPADAPRTASR